MTLLILDPGLYMVAGHHFELDTALLEAAAGLGVPGHIFCHHTDNPHLNDHPQITPFFGVLGGATTDDPILIDLDRFQLQNDRLYNDLVRLSDIVDLEQSTVLFPTASHNSLTGLGRWASQWTIPPRHLFVMLPGHFMFAIEGGAGTLDQLFYRYGFSRFPKDPGSRVTFLTLSSRQAREFSMIADRKVEQAPYPVGDLVDLSVESRPPFSGRRRVLTCGSSRDSKGFALLPEVIRRVAAKRADVEFVVQYCPTEDVSPSAIAAAGATVIEGYLDRSSYHAMIRSADVVLLPYLGPAYRVGTSAVFAEARWFGRPVIAATETSMADDVRADARLGLAVPPDVAALAAALETILDGYPHFAIAASEAAADYRRVNGTGRLAARMLGRA
jgi:glycosyltransferase involved in cell wall biosynthesis